MKGAAAPHSWGIERVLLQILVALGGDARAPLIWCVSPEESWKLPEAALDAAQFSATPRPVNWAEDNSWVPSFFGHLGIPPLLIFHGFYSFSKKLLQCDISLC